MLRTLLDLLPCLVYPWYPWYLIQAASLVQQVCCSPPRATACTGLPPLLGPSHLQAHLSKKGM